MDAVRQVATVGAGTVLAAAALLGAASPSSAATGEGFGVTTGNKLVRFPVANPGAETFVAQITGLQTGEKILGIDFRPSAPGDLYALTDQSRIYVIDETTAAATLKSTLSVPVQRRDANGDGVQDGDLDIDFNPSVDRLRIVTDAQQNLRVNVDTGATIVDGTLKYAAGDPNATRPTPARITGAAYTPSCAGGTTTLHDIDFSGDILSIQNPPNDGTLNTVGTLRNGSLTVNVTNLLGFDTDDTGQGWVAAQVIEGNAASTRTRFYRADLGTGAMTPAGDFSTEILRTVAIGIDPVAACANEPVIPEVPAAALLLLGGAAIAGTAVIRARRATA